MASLVFSLSVIAFLGVIVIALDNLKNAIETNTAAVTAAIAKLQTESVPASEVQAMADALNKTTDALNTAVGA